MIIKFNHTAHKKLWGWLAKHPDKEQADWPGWFACEYIFQKNTSCFWCPLKWPDGGDCGEVSNLWMRAKTLTDRQRYAEQIRDLPVKDWIECI